ncbi:hypothetical protein [Salinisphaera hydrothermalis]|uniref:FAD/NAD(P)-binding domain-containing protein n=1 Tax=Salinisphaera hydrothermalis (strain C41B8) TaxID=1304275 RepID=A0A084ILU6_SALHC|nr:hypothetical protein [Salinisphaera hydrothermalis]KEZ77680.1 hypothetical protein C41B8_08845 [Salinisphaera hydrothermalis C41B8]
MRHLVLVGLGQAHRGVLAGLHELGDAFRVTVVAPHDGRFGGATAALLAGTLPAERLRWSLPSGVPVIRSRAVGCQPIHRRLWLADGRVLEYDRLSLNLGTRRMPDWVARPGARQPRTWSGHSVRQLVELRVVLDAEKQAAVVIVGGSLTALEVAGGLAARIGRDGLDVRLLWPDGATGPRTRTALRRLAWLGVDVIDAQAETLATGCLCCRDGRRFAADHVIWAGAAEPGSSALGMSLPAASAGLRVDRRLVSPRASSVHVLGATASLDGYAVLAGWDGERQARVVLSGLRAETGTHALKRYAPPLREMPIDLGPAAGLVSSTPWLGWWDQRRYRRIQTQGLDGSNPSVAPT